MLQTDESFIVEGLLDCVPTAFACPLLDSSGRGGGVVADLGIFLVGMGRVVSCGDILDLKALGQGPSSGTWLSRLCRAPVHRLAAPSPFKPDPRLWCRPFGQRSPEQAVSRQLLFHCFSKNVFCGRGWFSAANGHFHGAWTLGGFKGRAVVWTRARMQCCPSGQRRLCGRAARLSPYFPTTGTPRPPRINGNFLRSVPLSGPASDYVDTTRLNSCFSWPGDRSCS